MAMTKAQKHRAAKTRERALARAAERRRMARVERDIAARAEAAAAAVPVAQAQPQPQPQPSPQPQSGLMSNAMLMPRPGSRFSHAKAMAAMLRAGDRSRSEPLPGHTGADAD